MILARKSSSKSGKNVPQDWTEGLAVLLNDTYKSQCKSDGRYFDVYGQIYTEELLVIISYVSEKSESDAPITLFLSSEANHIDSEKKVRDTQLAFTDLSGLFFDEIFANGEWDEFEPNWQEVDHKGNKFFFKITRENINLTLEANKLLGEEFIEEEEYDDETFQ